MLKPTFVAPSLVAKAHKCRVSKDGFVYLSFAFCILSLKMKLRSRVRGASNTIKREDISLQTNASSKARVSVTDAAFSVKQESESCATVKQEQLSSSTLINSNMLVEPNEDMGKAIKQEETSKAKIVLGRYTYKLKRRLN